MDFCSK